MKKQEEFKIIVIVYLKDKFVSRKFLNLEEVFGF